MDNEFKNYGLLLDTRSDEERSKDWIFGADNGIVKTILMPSNNWLPSLLKSNEKQHGIYFESMACVSFSAAKMTAMVMNTMIKMDLICSDDLKWLNDNGYIDQWGEVNFSERSLAKWSGTTKYGNSLWKVIDTIRKMGLIPQSKWDFKADQRMPVFDWDDFYADTPAELYILGLEFAKRFPLFYEYINTNDRVIISESRKYAPPQITVFAYEMPINGIFPSSTKSQNHAVVSVFDDELNKIRYIGDSYEDNYTEGIQFYKKLGWDYVYGGGYVVYLNPKIETMTYLKKKGSPDIYELEGDGKTLINIADMISWENKKSTYTEVDNLDGYIIDPGTWIYRNPRIN
jgi:hypothetical protein